MIAEAGSKIPPYNSGPISLIFKPLGAGREHLISVFGDGDGVFDADAADMRIVKSGFDGDDISGAQLFVYGR